MNLQLWDQELEGCIDDINALVIAEQLGQNQERQMLTQLKYSVLSLQNRLASIVEKLKDMPRRGELLKARRSKALLTWCEIYAKQLQKNHSIFINKLGKLLWLKLVYAGLPEISSNPLNKFSDETLLELAIRKNQLEETVSLIEEKLAQSLQEQTRLRAEYVRIRTIQENRQAAGSMYARFGKNRQEALAHPVLQYLKTSINNLAQIMFPIPRRYPYLRDIQQEVNQRTEHIIAACKQLVMSELHHPQRRLDDRVKDREYSAYLRELNDMREQLAVAASMFRPQQSQMHPTLQKTNT